MILAACSKEYTPPTTDQAQAVQYAQPAEQAKLYYITTSSGRHFTCASPEPMAVQAAAQCSELFQNDPLACECEAYAKGAPWHAGPETGCEVLQDGQWVKVTP